MPDPSAALHPLLSSRWSPLRFDDSHSLDPDEVAVLLEAARWAPSAGNSQPWAFVVGRRGDAVHRRLVSHLAPCARLRLSRDPALDLLGARTTEPAPTHARPGWVRALNGEHDPTMTHRNVSTLRYEQVRPFHPERLRDTLDDIDEGTYGRVVRSAGFTRLATRLGIAQWDQVGSALWLNPIPADEGDPLAIGQDLALTGRGLDGDALRRALDDAALDDAEFAAGPAVWRSLADPFPAWDTVDAAAPEDDLPGGERR